MIYCLTRRITDLYDRGLYMVTEARKRANAKWDKENMTIIGCKVKKDYAARASSG